MERHLIRIDAFIGPLASHTRPRRIGQPGRVRHAPADVDPNRTMDLLIATAAIVDGASPSRRRISLATLVGPGT